jgi:hypothetical protein
MIKKTRIATGEILYIRRNLALPPALEVSLSYMKQIGDGEKKKDFISNIR